MCPIDLPLKDVPRPTTAYLDEIEPLLKIPIWRGCSAALETADSVWLPALKESGLSQGDTENAKQVKRDGDGSDAEEDEKTAQEFREHMIDKPWVKAAARATKRQGKVGRKRDKKNRMAADEKTNREK